jgi:hypothetical protein
VSPEQNTPKLLKNLPDYFYKYRKFDERTVTLIANSVFYFSKPDQFNDPFDCGLKYSLEGSDKEWRVALTRSLRQHHPALSSTEVEAKVEEKICAGTHRDIAFLTKMDAAARETANSRIGIFCLSADPQNILMWGHYADCHKGCCLEFSTKSEVFRRADKIVYSKKYPAVRLVDWMGVKNSEMHSQFGILTKSEHWAYEQEWRLWHMGGSGLYPFGQASLTGVVFGCWMTKENKDELRKLVTGRDPKVNLYQAVPKNREFEMELLPLN